MNSTRPPSELERENRKAAIAALGQAVRAYWEHAKALPLPDHLAKLAATADEASSLKPVTPTDLKDAQALP
jgi:hypothetical protein